MAAVIADGLDVVFRGTDTLRVVGAMLMDQHGLQLLLKPLIFVRRISAIAAVWKLDAGVARCSPERIRPVACWCADGQDFVVLGM